MGRGSASSRRWVAVLAVTYVLVLQSFLSGAVLAALPIGASHQLCLNTTDAAGSGSDQTDGGEADPGHAGKVHCQACLARADMPTLPPLAPAVEIDRFAIELKFDAVVRIALRQFDSRRPFQPRAPPSAPAA